MNEKVVEALREIVLRAESPASLTTPHNVLRGVRNLAESALRELEGEEEWDFVHIPNGGWTPSNSWCVKDRAFNTVCTGVTSEHAKRIARLPRLERIERAALRLVKAWNSAREDGLSLAATSAAAQALDRALGDGE